MQHLFDQLSRQRYLGDHPLAAGMEAVQGRVLLVGVQVRGKDEVLEPVRVLVDDPPARLVHRLRHHVLAGGVTGGEVEAEKAHPAQRVLLDVAKLAESGRLLGLGLDGGEALIDPVAEVACGPGVAEHEDGCPLHGVVDDRRRDSTRFAGDPHASAVAGDQSALGGCQRHEVLSARVLAVNEQRAGEPQGHLGHAAEALHVPGYNAGIEREGGDVIEACARLRAHHLAPRRRGLTGVVVVFVAREAVHGRSCSSDSQRRTLQEPTYLYSPLGTSGEV